MEAPKISVPNFGRSPLEFLQESRQELKKVKWPTKEEVVRMTTIVIIVSIFVGFFISSLDYLFTKIMQIVVK